MSSVYTEGLENKENVALRAPLLSNFKTKASVTFERQVECCIPQDLPWGCFIANMCKVFMASLNLESLSMNLMTGVRLLFLEQIQFLHTNVCR